LNRKPAPTALVPTHSRGAKINIERCQDNGETVTIPAKYENGVFRPLENVAMREGTVVEVHVPGKAGP
jgi:hypothetical protein